jgi:guanylate kinase
MQQPASPHKNVVLIICGPAGSGKTTLCDQLLEAYPGQVTRLVTTTSRAPRPGEVDGTDYHFLDPATFEKRIEDGAFIEWAKVHGRYYGSQKAHIEALLQSGSDILLNIDSSSSPSRWTNCASACKGAGRTMKRKSTVA